MSFIEKRMRPKTYGDASRYYTDRHAADDLRRELRRYARDKESFVYTAIDFVMYVFNRAEAYDAADEVQFIKQQYIRVGDKLTPEEKEKGVKKALDALCKTLMSTNYQGVGLTLENEAVRHFGELDYHREEVKAKSTIQYIGQQEEEAFLHAD